MFEGILFLPVSTSVCKARVIEKFNMPQIVKNKGQISTVISIEEHNKKWKKQKERTASVRTKLIFNNLKWEVRMYILLE